MKTTYMLSFFPMTSKIEMQSQEKGFDLILTSFFFFFLILTSWWRLEVWATHTYRRNQCFGSLAPLSG